MHLFLHGVAVNHTLALCAVRSDAGAAEQRRIDEQLGQIAAQLRAHSPLSTLERDELLAQEKRLKQQRRAADPDAFMKGACVPRDPRRAFVVDRQHAVRLTFRSLLSL
jgi:hypothetical protein